LIGIFFLLFCLSRFFECELAQAAGRVERSFVLNVAEARRLLVPGAVVDRARVFAGAGARQVLAGRSLPFVEFEIVFSDSKVGVVDDDDHVVGAAIPAP